MKDKTNFINEIPLSPDMDFLKTVLKKEEKKAPDVSPFLKKVAQEFKERGVKVDVLLGGSLAKNTFLFAHDIDVFVRFKEKPDSSLLEDVLQSITKNVTRIHGSRDYFHVRYNDIDYEVVPLLKISKPSQAENTPDVSPFHISWVNKHLKNPDEVRLAKLFCKGQSVYGAESYIQGFSGYALEILIVHYGSFLKFVHAVSTWQPKEVIDTEKHYKSTAEALRRMNDAKVEGPLIIVDPIDKKRNAAAALSTEKWAALIDGCRSFLQYPSKNFFKVTLFNRQIFLSTCRKHKTTPYILAFEALAHREDISFGKVKKVFTHLKTALTSADFDLYSYGIDWNKKVMWFEVAEPLHPVKKVMGPMLWAQEKHIVEFQVKYKYWDIQATKYVAFQKRVYTKAKSLLKKELQSAYVKEKVKKLRIL